MIDEREYAWGQMVIAEALAWVGTPYRHQASRKGVACDCLGLVRGVWRSLYGSEPEEAGVYSKDWAEATGEERLLRAAERHFIRCSKDELLPGKLVLFRWRSNVPAKHAGILLDATQFIHAYEGSAVTVSPLAPQWRRRIAGIFAFPVKTEK
ncbi:peptidase [Nitratireductor aestuarii]|uniref:Peptidase n=1 Tax=Nitratireductor aestuarii TaxID=1735103 RepID=A0A916W8M6_9HYPH|nr:NlpC/P60 family protein [Nitratireductor aestuarii]GGA75857.1 peptidase [Nitratireductor aestuarii]